MSGNVSFISMIKEQRRQPVDKTNMTMTENMKIEKRQRLTDLLLEDVIYKQCFLVLT